jgi:hypothetical protein
MLDGKELARRVTEAMDSAKPKITGAAVAKACSVTPQAVNGWRKNGRLHKRHLSLIAKMTGRPLSYFLEDTCDIANGAASQKVDLRAGEVAQLFYWLTEKEKVELLSQVRSMARGNRALLKEMAGKLDPPSDDFVKNHIPLPKK